MASWYTMASQTLALPATVHLSKPLFLLSFSFYFDCSFLDGRLTNTYTVTGFNLLLTQTIAIKWGWDHHVNFEFHMGIQVRERVSLPLPQVPFRNRVWLRVRAVRTYYLSILYVRSSDFLKISGRGDVDSDSDLSSFGHNLVSSTNLSSHLHFICLAAFWFLLLPEDPHIIAKQLRRSSFFKFE